ncbi:uncharacterized protein Dwil_GK19152 [Drosophila willistoni]|uniref:Chitin-binding type-2 domain-containing protein n=1 Tax=Drosophila willistoni TaxID=7260 RepID=B4N3R6_DROWI|nr:uncharacterized protein Dwil_GK19152 [Drosophila willistoni]
MDINPLPDALDQTATDTAVWNADDACVVANRTTTFQNQADQTCNSYIYCYLSNGIYRAQIRKCKLYEYFDELLKSCSTTQPEGCINE